MTPRERLAAICRQFGVPIDDVYEQPMENGAAMLRRRSGKPFPPGFDEAAREHFGAKR